MFTGRLFVSQGIKGDKGQAGERGIPGMAGAPGPPGHPGLMVKTSLHQLTSWSKAILINQQSCNPAENISFSSPFVTLSSRASLAMTVLRVKMWVMSGCGVCPHLRIIARDRCGDVYISFSWWIFLPLFWQGAVGLPGDSGQPGQKVPNQGGTM